jgi:hypothetical protein
MKYKNLKSVAHNLGHAFFSSMNYRGSDYIIEYLYKKAKEINKSDVIIDYLNEIIEPAEFRITEVLESLHNYREYLTRELNSQKCSIDYVKEIKMYINFDLSNIIFHESINNLELAVYKCKVEIIDDRNKVHIGIVPEWWKY